MSNIFLNELPSYYLNVREFRELSQTVVTGWDELYEAFFNVENDQFILSAGEAAITLWEKDFAIAPDRHTETLEFRRRRLLARKKERANLVYAYLKSILDNMIGADAYEIELDIDTFEMGVFVSPEALLFREVQNLVERIVPLNIALQTAFKFESISKISNVSYIQTASQLDIYPMNIGDVLQYAQSLNAAGMHTASTVTITPM
ncbi:DUF2313 domain-containing protein [Metasolibacillus meyeri]|uniref:DUF2313 domain-containing protein n=1 Tax=Metasolibacillus meyeri TaxID=1071052 RepID=A0AAW9NPY8_9BACL|nr:putative phage tail protein [Metasolibacillus meyeri]MEC1178551.1 DUF2313 domain-containing protein [Metasolibacillus meyeri]